MNKELANVLKGKLLTLPFADLVAGMAQVLTVQQLSSDNATTITTRRPVTYDAWFKTGGSCEGQEVSLVPDSKWKSIIYFEDLGVAPLGTLRKIQGYSSSLRLICWLNRAALVGETYAEISARCQSAIISRLAHRNPQNIGIFTRLTINVERIPPQTPELFSKYTYDETDRQYLRPPFEFFGIDFRANFYVPVNCMDEINWNAQTCS